MIEVDTSNTIDISAQNALTWLRNSGIERVKGGFASIYKAKTDEYISWGKGATCLLSTAGALEAFLIDNDIPKSQDIANHILSLRIKGGFFEGAMLDGLGSRGVNTYYLSQACLALLKFYEKTNEKIYLDAAKKGIYWIIENARSPEGFIRSYFSIDGSRDSLKEIFYRLPSSWQAIFINSFLKLHSFTKDDILKEAAEALAERLLKMQDKSGKIFLYEDSFKKRFFDLLLFMSGKRSRINLVHAASQAYLLEAFLSMGMKKNAELLYEWSKDNLSPNGLFYQFYYTKNLHSKEEDVMPTAMFGEAVLGSKMLEAGKDLLCKISRGLIYSQINCSNTKLNGAMRGLPLDVSEHDNPYTWDTTRSIIFLKKVNTAGVLC